MMASLHEHSLAGKPLTEGHFELLEKRSLALPTRTGNDCGKPLLGSVLTRRHRGQGDVTLAHTLRRAPDGARLA